MTAELARRLGGTIRQDTLAQVPDETLRDAIMHLVDESRETIRAILFFGSRTCGAGANVHSAYDLFVVVDAYGSFYQAMSEAGLTRKSPWLLQILNRILPPNQLSYRRIRDGETPFHGKCAVLTLEHFLRETSPASRDHFCQGRLFQPVSLVYARDAATQTSIVNAQVDVRRHTLRWIAPYLPSEFDADGYSLRCLEVSLAGELRPESSSRASRLAEAQRHRQHPISSALLELFEAEGRLERVQGDTWRLARKPSFSERLHLRLYFGLSLGRATLRWAKHILTFEDWLEYLVRKVERHSGQRIELTERERRYPLVFLWPRFYRHMKSKNQEKAR